jgi:hypothetical protein
MVRSFGTRKTTQQSFKTVLNSIGLLNIYLSQANQPPVKQKQYNFFSTKQEKPLHGD